MEPGRLRNSRHQLFQAGLIAYEKPLYQILEFGAGWPNPLGPTCGGDILRNASEVPHDRLPNLLPNSVSPPRRNSHCRADCARAPTGLENRPLMGASYLSPSSFAPTAPANWSLQAPERPAGNGTTFGSADFPAAQASRLHAKHRRQKLVRQSGPKRSSRFPDAALSARGVRPGRLGLRRLRSGGHHATAALLLCHGALLQPPDVCRVHPRAEPGTLPGLPPARLRILQRRGPAEVMVDNCKTAVLTRCDRPVVFNPRYLDFARHYGFAVKACGVRTAPRKRARGKRRRLTSRRTSWPGWNSPVWRAQCGGAPVAGRGGQCARPRGDAPNTPGPLRPAEKLKPLHPLAYDAAVLEPVRVNRRFRVTVDTNRYSVPPRMLEPTHPQGLSRSTLPLSSGSAGGRAPAQLRAASGLRNPEHVQPSAAGAPEGPRPTAAASLPGPLPAGAGVLPAPGTAAQPPPSRPEDRRLERDLRRRKSATRLGGRLGLSSLQLRIHRQPAGTTRSGPPLNPGRLHLTRQQDLLDLDLPAPDSVPLPIPGRR